MDAQSMAEPQAETAEVVEVPAPDMQPVIYSIETGFAMVTLGIGLIAGLIFSKIVNWWKW